MSKSALRFLSLPVLATLLLLIGSPPTGAQKPGSKYHTDPENGFRFKPLKDFDGVPIPPDQKDSGLIARMSGPTQIIKMEVGVSQLDAEMSIYALASPEAAEVEVGRTTSKGKRPDVLDIIGKKLRGLDKVAKTPEVDEELEIKKVEARHRVFRSDAGSFKMIIDVWTFDLEHADINIVYVFSADKDKKWLAATKKSAKTFQVIERVVAESSGDAGGQQSYAEMLKSAEAEAARTEGWRAVPTPTEKFIILTSATKDKFIRQVIERLEKSREVFEEDFPPPADFDAVSIVRLCQTEDEFHNYGGTGGGVAGWFNPGTTELVLYNSKDVDPNATFAVMSHEAFHQYCHFLFGQSEAHRWFDEGHGDYYGGIEIKGGKVKIDKQMPGGLDRLPVIREMVREESYKPVEAHINYSHSQWQNQGPSNVSCYAQSWSIIYFLRQGTLKKVRGKMWKKEYADIIPNYVETLAAGFQEAYAEIRAKRQERADKEKRELTEEEAEINRRDLREDAKQAIWKKAMDASWGKVDIDQFELDWIAFIEDVL